MTEREARARYIDSMMKLTVWVRQRPDGSWEAIDYHGGVIAGARLRNEVDIQLRNMACNKANGIHAIAYVTAPEDRRPFKSKPTRRSL